MINPLHKEIRTGYKTRLENKTLPFVGFVYLRTFVRTFSTEFSLASWRLYERKSVFFVLVRVVRGKKGIKF